MQLRGIEHWLSLLYWNTNSDNSFSKQITGRDNTVYVNRTPRYGQRFRTWCSREYFG